MTERALDIVILGLSLSSSWGNGHATTFRALIRGLSRLGHRVTFLERDVPWYAGNRDLADPDFCRLGFDRSVADLDARFTDLIARADAVVVGSYVPDGIAVLDHVLANAGGTVSFYDIDTPVTLAALNRGEETYLARRQIPELDVYFSFTGGPMVETLERGFGAPLAAPLYCSVEEAAYRPLDLQKRWDLGYLGTYSPDRQPMLDRLLIETARRLPDHRFVVAGPQYPREIDWPDNVDRIEHLPPADHAAFYGRQRWTLNVTRADMVAAGWSPSVRLFEAAACGTPIVSDDWPGLSSLLPDGEAIVIAGHTEEVVALLQSRDEEERFRIAAAARTRVLDGHTGKARAEEMAKVLRSVAGNGSRHRARTGALAAIG